MARLHVGSYIEILGLMLYTLSVIQCTDTWTLSVCVVYTVNLIMLGSLYIGEISCQTFFIFSKIIGLKDKRLYFSNCITVQ